MTSFFQKLFTKEKPVRNGNDPDTIPLKKPEESTPLENPANDPPEPPPSIPQLVAGCGQSVGEQREQNEDALFTLTTLVASDTRQIPFGLYIIADGMGGHQHGEIASAVAVRAMANHIVQKVYLPLISLSAKSPDQPLQEIMQDGVMEAHRAILKSAPGSGTTLTAALIIGEQMTLAHVGDSRAYTIRPDGSFEVITRDHSLVKRLVELGQLTPEEAADHPQRNVLYRALGQGEPFDPDVITSPVPQGSQLLLCSDGLWGVISEDDLVALTNSTSSPTQACTRLVDAANAAGGPDNISVILVRFPIF